MCIYIARAVSAAPPPFLLSFFFLSFHQAQDTVGTFPTAQNLKCGFRIPDSGSRIHDPGSRNPEPGSWNSEPGS